MKRFLILALVISLTVLIPNTAAFAVDFTDASGRTVSIDNPQRVVALYGSYGDVWRIAGSTLAGTTSDLPAGDDGAQVLGSHTEPNMELLFTLNPDFVILSADAAEHQEIAQMLDQANVPYALFSHQDYRGYMEMVKLFTEITGREDLYQAQVDQVELPIQAMVNEAAEFEGKDHPTALLLRAYSTNVRAKGSEGTVAGCILKDMGFDNIADGDSPLSENLSMEAILLADPDYIFVTTMGSSTEAALESLASLLTNNPAWATLTAVRNDHFYVLDKELFHQHPNARWAESYAIIRDILLGE